MSTAEHVHDFTRTQDENISHVFGLGVELNQLTARVKRGYPMNYLLFGRISMFTVKPVFACELTVGVLQIPINNCISSISVGSKTCIFSFDALCLLDSAFWALHDCHRAKNGDLKHSVNLIPCAYIRFRYTLHTVASGYARKMQHLTKFRTIVTVYARRRRLPFGPSVVHLTCEILRH
jgi:hypothetical protein